MPGSTDFCSPSFHHPPQSPPPALYRAFGTSRITATRSAVGACVPAVRAIAIPVQAKCSRWRRFGSPRQRFQSHNRATGAARAPGAAAGRRRRGSAELRRPSLRFVAGPTNSPATNAPTRRSRSPWVPTQSTTSHVTPRRTPTQSSSRTGLCGQRWSCPRPV